MCLIVFSWQPDQEQPLILLANRDEFYQRPALPVDTWTDNPDIFGGRDIEAGGGWLAVDNKGRLATVTNYREWPKKIGERSRGELVSQFLSSDKPALDYLQSIQEYAQQYAGFNLLLADSSGLYYFSNRSQPLHIQKLNPGTYGLCNHQLDTPWPKLIKARARFQEVINHSDLPDPASLLQIMQDEEKPEDALLPNTGVGLDMERLLSSPFISSRDYGTRNTSLLMFNRHGGVNWTEQSYQPFGEPESLKRFEINKI